MPTGPKGQRRPALVGNAIKVAHIGTDEDEDEDVAKPDPEEEARAMPEALRKAG
jgi:hypothetical protein